MDWLKRATTSESAEEEKTREDILGWNDQTNQQTSLKMQIEEINPKILAKEERLKDTETW